MSGSIRVEAGLLPATAGRAAQPRPDIAMVILSNPGRLNALDRAMWQGLRDTLRALSQDNSLRYIVLRGEGEAAFAAGADIAEFVSERDNAAQGKVYGELIHDSMQAIAQCRHPTLAMIHGACVGGGLEIAASCDLRICGQSSRFGVPVNKLGLVMGYGEMQGLLQLAGRATALEIVLEGRVFAADEALAKGLVTRVVEDARVTEEAMAAACRIADGAPLVARWHKQFINRLGDAQPLRPDEVAQGYACYDTQDYRTGRAAFLNKTKPHFEGH